VFVTALARKLQSRGDEVRFFGVPDVEPAVRAANLAFEPHCEEEYPAGSVACQSGELANSLKTSGGQNGHCCRGRKSQNLRRRLLRLVLVRKLKSLLKNQANGKS